VTILSDDPDQESVLADVGQRLLITAPPGSGKTLTAVRLVARDVDAGRIGPTQRALVLTFSLQARAQLDRYATQLLVPDQRRRTEITNYHSWFWQKIRQFRSSLGLPAELDLATESEHHQDVLGAMVRAGQATAATTWDDKARLYARALEFEVEGCRPDTLSEPLPSCTAVGAQLVSAHRAGRFHYDDMAYYMWRLVDESATLRAIWRHKYPVVVLDEYQDASPIQARIIERLLGPESRV
jgi:superfamily I DNA/RNA helicase